MRILWTENAIDHLANIYEYIAFNSPTYARHMIDRITRRTEQIAEHNLSGRKVPEYDAEDIRELIEKPNKSIRIQEITANQIYSLVFNLYYYSQPICL